MNIIIKNLFLLSVFTIGTKCLAMEERPINIFIQNKGKPIKVRITDKRTWIKDSVGHSIAIDREVKSKLLTRDKNLIIHDVIPSYPLIIILINEKGKEFMSYVILNHDTAQEWWLHKDNTVKLTIRNFGDNWEINPSKE